MLLMHPLVQFKRGDHICLFYRDEDSLIESLAAYLKGGLANHERCFCAQKTHIIPKLHLALKMSGVDVETAISGGALEIHTEDEVYFPDGRFQPATMMAMLERSIDESLAQGYSGFRTAGEMSWALERRRPDGRDYCDQLADYEHLVQAAYPGKAAVGMCQYPAHRFPRRVVEKVLAAHALSLEETMVSSRHSTLTVRSGEFLADIVGDRINAGSAFHYVIQRRGTPEILSWGIEPTMEQAWTTSEGILEELQAEKAAKRTRL